MAVEHLLGLGYGHNQIAQRLAIQAMAPLAGGVIEAARGARWMVGPDVVLRWRCCWLNPRHTETGWLA